MPSTSCQWTKPWCPGLVSRPSAKAQEPVARIRGLVIHPQKLSVGAYFEISFLGCGFLIHLSNRSDSPRFRAPWKKIRQKYGHNRNRHYSRAIHCPASMEKHYFQWFLLKSVQNIMVCEKIRFCLLESGQTKLWCPGLVSWPSAKAQEPLARSRNQCQEVEGLLFSQKNSQLVIF